ncbi:MAG: hypothetical protein ISN29_10710, partial [Gammaproteobacteria bacterium AqS3]|nr:hypothetical protein [Gammaproteobacteria bacterium AqS3]
GQSAAAAVLARQALDHEPPMGAYERVLAMVEYGEILWNLGYEEAAQGAWERAWNDDSNHVDVLEAVEKYDLAFQDRSEENDERAEYTAEVIEHAAYIDEEEGAEKAYEYLTALNWLGYGLTEPLLYQQAYYAKKAGMNEEAENIYRTLIELNPEEAHYLDHLGFLLATESDRLVEARLILREALELSPEDPSIMDSYGWVLYRLGRLEEASELLGTAAEIVISYDNPDLQVSILTRYGIVLWESEMYEDAINAWDYAWRIDSENEFLAQTLVEYAEVYGYSFFQERFEEEPGILR